MQVYALINIKDPGVALAISSKEDTVPSGYAVVEMLLLETPEHPVSIKAYKEVRTLSDAARAAKGLTDEVLDILKADAKGAMTSLDAVSELHVRSDYGVDGRLIGRIDSIYAYQPAKSFYHTDNTAPVVDSLSAVAQSIELAKAKKEVTEKLSTETQALLKKKFKI